MTSGFPQYTRTSKQGDLGVSIVSRIVDEDFQWLFKRNHQEHDFGIDGQIEVVTEDGRVTGQMLACQIKCGPSFFRETNRWGWVYRGETKHFNYLANYPIPVIIVICDPVTKEGYWALFSTRDAEITDSGWKLTIAKENKLSSSKADIEECLPDVEDHLSLLKDYWRLNKLFLESQLLLFPIERDEVERGDVSRIEVFRNRITSSKEVALHCQGKVEFSFSGYDDDPRQLYEFDEIKRYMPLLNDAFPELFFFVSTREPKATLTLFVFSLFGVGINGDWPDRKVIVDLSTSENFMLTNFAAMNSIAESVGLSDPEILQLSKRIFESIGVVPKQ